MTDAAPPTVVDLDELAEAMDRSMDDPCEPLLDNETGNVAYAPDPDITGFDDPDLQRALDDQPDRFLSVPRVGGHDEYRWMEAFVETIADQVARVRLSDALAGRGAFSRFARCFVTTPTCVSAGSPSGPNA